MSKVETVLFPVIKCLDTEPATLLIINNLSKFIFECRGNYYKGESYVKS